MYNADDFEVIVSDFIGLIENIEDDSTNTDENREIMNRTIYTMQQCIGCSLDALPTNVSNTARKINGDLFEKLIRQLLCDMNITCESGIVQIPVKIDGEFAFNMSYQHDLIIKSDGKIHAVGSVKTSSKDRIDKIFIDKFLYNKLNHKKLPHFAIFLNDVQRKNTTKKNKYSINSTFLPGHFKGYTIKLNPLDGVYYCDIRPNMLTENILKDHIKTFDHFIFEDIWKFL
jgi:hypothetical protein